MKKLTKIVTGAATAASMLYLLASPAFAVVQSNVSLCPTGSGFNVPGCNGADLGAIISSGLNILLFAAFIIALVFLIIGGLRWIMSGGDKEATGKAKATVTSALVGLVVVIGAWVLINIVLQLLTGQTLGNLNGVVPSLTTGCQNGTYVNNSGQTVCK